MLSVQRLNISSGAPWEDKVGYCRAVRVGNIIEVSGTTAFADGKVVGENDVYAQCICIFKKVEDALHQAGAGLKDVVRTRTFITDVNLWPEYARAHEEIFGQIRPAASLIGINALIDPAMLVEIEVTAIITGE
jgi:enamine deaminase RidA (YjgF/YER057c/UK114 family)